MRFAILFIITLVFNSAAAKYGDTIKVRTHDKVLIQTDPSKGFTEYGKWGNFPTNGKTFYKVYAELTFQCPPGMTCGEWDYLNHIYIGKRKGTYNDSLYWEIMRFVTPYGLQFNSQWKHTWKYDISDFASLLKDSIEIIYRHSGYEARNGRGWLVTLDFTFIEGPEIRHIEKVSRLFQGSVSYGNDSIFDARMTTANYTTGEKTSEIRYKIIQTGHGMDQPDNCAEFCPKLRYIVHDDKGIDTSYVWRTDCGENPVFPQGGTWIYDRTNWCPGAEVREYNLDVKVDPKSNHSMDLDMQKYTRTGSSSNWVITNYLVEYSGYNFKTDASIEEIIRPTDELQYLRVNPACGEPRIIVRNNGSNSLQSLLIEYGWENRSMQRFQWNGNLSFGQNDTIDLPYLTGTAAAGSKFIARLVWINNQTDEYDGNNTLTSIPTKRVDELPSKFVIMLRTNNAPSENYYTLKKADGTMIRERSKLTSKNTTFFDTVNLEPGCYSLTLMDDGTPPSNYPLNEDGLGWWANSSDGSGVFQLRSATSLSILKVFNVDFGTGIWYQFRVGNIPETPPAEARIAVYPNPVHNTLLIDLGVNRKNEELSLELYDLLGRKVFSESRKGDLNALQYLDVINYTRGTYVLKIKTNDKTITEKIILN